MCALSAVHFKWHSTTKRPTVSFYNISLWIFKAMNLSMSSTATSPTIVPGLARNGGNSNYNDTMYVCTCTSAKLYTGIRPIIIILLESTICTSHDESRVLWHELFPHAKNRYLHAKKYMSHDCMCHTNVQYEWRCTCTLCNVTYHMYMCIYTCTCDMYVFMWWSLSIVGSLIIALLSWGSQ